MGFKLFEGNIDCLGIKNNDFVLIGEIKTLDGSKSDEDKQVKKAFAQLFYYEEFEMGQFSKISCKKIVVFDRKIRDEHIDFFNKNGIQVFWKCKNKLCNNQYTIEKYISSLI